MPVVIESYIGGQTQRLVAAISVSASLMVASEHAKVSTIATAKLSMIMKTWTVANPAVISMCVKRALFAEKGG